MKVLNLIALAFFLSFCTITSCQEVNKKVHLTGNFPDFKGGRVFMYSQNINTPLINGKFDISLDSSKEGEYTIIIIYPWPKADTIFVRDSTTGSIVKKRTRVTHTISLAKKFYINPNQSLHYYFQLSGNVSDEMLINWKVINYGERGVYGVKITSDAEDTRLYDKFQQLERNYEDGSFYRIVDSLYKQDTDPNKDYPKFYTEATKLNIKNNYLVYSASAKALIKKNLTNPISALIVLNTPNKEFDNQKNDYQKLLNVMSGRAKNSEYYRLSLLKLKDAKDVLREGNDFILPTGKTPDLKQLKYSLAKYKYTLVEFWASWCPPCRAQAPEWNNLLKKYKDKGFQILGISLDNSLIRWRKAIKDDKTEEWLHVSDLGQGYYGVNALKYGIDSIPCNVLLDSSGKIIKNKIKPEQLDEILNKNN